MISALSLSKAYEGRCVVDDISFDIQKGQFSGILGPNGAGKTTLLRILLGHLPFAHGRLTVLGMPIPQGAREMRKRVGVVPQTDNLDPDLTVHENLYVYGRYFGIDRALLDRRIPELLDFAALKGRSGQRINQLSGGMKRRLTIARALINNPELLILDEPTTGLDPQARHTIWYQLRQLQKGGLTLVLTTHYMEEAERLCDRIILIDHGRVLADQTPHSLISRQIENHVLEIHGSGAVEWSTTVQTSAAVRTERVGETCFFYGDDLQHLVDSLDKQPGLRYSYRQANLEDVFLKLTGRELRDV